MPANGSLALQHRLTRQITSLVGPARIKALHTRSAARTLFTLSHVWAAIALTFYAGNAGLSLSPAFGCLCLVLLAAFMATRQNALNVLVHEGAHRSLAPSRRLNSWLTNWFAGYAIGFDEDSYRALHLSHHRYLNEAKDPDRPLYALPASRAGLVRCLLEDLSGVSFARRALVYARDARTAPPERRARKLTHLCGKVALNLSLLGALTALAGPVRAGLLYLVLWIVPLASFYPVLIRIRVITEHFAPEVFRSSGAGVFVARTSVCGPIEHYLLGAQMDFHFEHHLFPGVPYARLAELHGALVERGFFENATAVTAEHSLSGGYVRFWANLLRDDASWNRAAGVESPT